MNYFWFLKIIRYYFFRRIPIWIVCVFNFFWQSRFVVDEQFKTVYSLRQYTHYCILWKRALKEYIYLMVMVIHWSFCLAMRVQVLKSQFKHNSLYVATIVVVMTDLNTHTHTHMDEQLVLVLIGFFIHTVDINVVVRIETMIWIKEKKIIQRIGRLTDRTLTIATILWSVSIIIIIILYSTKTKRKKNKHQIYCLLILFVVLCNNNNNNNKNVINVGWIRFHW